MPCELLVEPKEARRSNGSGRQAREEPVRQACVAVVECKEVGCFGLCQHLSPVREVQSGFGRRSRVTGDADFGSFSKTRSTCCAQDALAVVVRPATSATDRAGKPQCVRAGDAINMLSTMDFLRRCGLRAPQPRQPSATLQGRLQPIGCGGGRWRPLSLPRTRSAGGSSQEGGESRARNGTASCRMRERDGQEGLGEIGQGKAS